MDQVWLTWWQERARRRGSGVRWRLTTEARTRTKCRCKVVANNRSLYTGFDGLATKPSGGWFHGLGLKTMGEDLALPGQVAKARRGASIRRTRGLTKELASEGSKVVVDAIPAGRIFAKMSNLPLRGVYHLGVV